MSRLPHPLLQLLDTSLSGIPTQPVTVEGEWSTTSRRTYASATQSGGDGPFVEVVDCQWTGALRCASDVGAIAFLTTERAIHWSKAPAISAALPIQISLHAYRDYSPGRATFWASIAGAYVPGVPIAGAASPETCTLGPVSLTTGRVLGIAEADRAVFSVVALPREVLKVGRNHLWRLREEVAASLPQNIRELLTRRRTGTLEDPPTV